MAVGDTMVDGHEPEAFLASGDGGEEGTAMAISDAVINYTDKENDMPIIDTRATTASCATITPDNNTTIDEIPIDGATAMPFEGATAMAMGGATAMQIDCAMALPIDGATAMPNDGATAMPTDCATVAIGFAMDCEPSASLVNLCKVCGHRHLLDENHEYNYKDQVDDDLVCHICLQPLISPLDTPCGHTYCQECLTNFLVESDFCPVDRVTILLQNCRKSSVLVHKLLDKLTVACPFSEHCYETMPRGEMQAHLQSR